MEEKRKKITWIRGRKGICENGRIQAITRSFQMCPKTLESMKNFCARHNILKSVVVNEAVMAYIALNDDKE